MMDIGATLGQETLKTIPSLLASLITLGLGWLIGQRLTAQWNLRQKQRELDLSAAAQFYSLYGEFFAVWKLWNYYIRDVGQEVFQNTPRWDLLIRACAAESGIEALFVRLSAERQLTTKQIELLGRFRQAYQSLREVIRDNQPLTWDHSNHDAYVSFKRLGTAVAVLIFRDKLHNMDYMSKSADVLGSITSNKWEHVWKDPDWI